MTSPNEDVELIEKEKKISIFSILRHSRDPSLFTGNGGVTDYRILSVITNSIKFRTCKSDINLTTYTPEPTHVRENSFRSKIVFESRKKHR